MIRNENYITEKVEEENEENFSIKNLQFEVDTTLHIEEESVPERTGSNGLSDILVIHRSRQGESLIITCDNKGYVDLYKASTGSSSTFKLEKRVKFAWGSENEFECDLSCLSFDRENYRVLVSESVLGIHFLSIEPEFKRTKSVAPEAREIYRMMPLGNNRLLYCTAEFGGEIWLWKDMNNEDFDQFEMLYKLEFQAIYAMCKLKSEKYENHVAFGGGMGKRHGIRLIDLQNIENVTEFENLYRNDVTCLASIPLSPTKEYIISGSKDHRIIFWSTKGMALRILEDEVKIDIHSVISYNSGTGTPIFVFGGEKGKLIMIDLSRRKVFLNQVTATKGWWIENMQIFGGNRFVCCTRNGFVVCRITGLGREESTSHKSWSGDVRERTTFLKEYVEWKKFAKLFV